MRSPKLAFAAVVTLAAVPLWPLAAQAEIAIRPADEKVVSSVSTLGKRKGAIGGGTPGAGKTEKRPGIPQTRPIYDPQAGGKGRNLPRFDIPLCSNWHGGPKGTLVPAKAGGQAVPLPGQHGLVALGFGGACDRGEVLLQFSTRGENLFARGAIYSEDVGAYSAPNGVTVRNDRDRVAYNLGLGWIGKNGSFLSIGARRMARDQLLFQGVGAGVDTRDFNVEGYDIAGRFRLDGAWISQLRFNARFNEIERINDNFTYRVVPQPDTEVRLERETMDAKLALDGDVSGVKWGVGLDYASDKRDATKFRGAALAPFSANFADAQVSVIGLTANGTWALGSGRRLKAGVRVEHVDASLGDMDRALGAPSPRALFQQTYGYTGTGATSETNFGANLRFEQSIWGGQGQWFAGLSYTPRTANPRERYYANFTNLADPQIRSTWIGNPDLAPERHAMLEMGGGARQGAWSFAGRAYADWVEDFILWDRARGQSGVLVADHRNIYRNVDAFIGGLEGTVTRQWSNGVYAGAEIWLTYGKNTTDGRPIAQIPPAEAALKLGWKGRTMSFEGTWHLAAKQSRVDDSIFTGSGADGDGYGNALASGYGTLDLAASWQPRKNTVFSIGVENVFDKDYVQLIERGSLNSPFLFNPTSPGRSFWAKVVIRF